MMPEIAGRLIPEPVGFDDEVKGKAAHAERSWEAVTGLLAALGGGAPLRSQLALLLPPAAPFIAAVAAGSFYFKLRAKWAKEDPARYDFDLAAEYRHPDLDPVAILPPGPMPPGAAIVSLLHSAGASVEATVISLERAMGADLAAWESREKPADRVASARRIEAYSHARRTAVLTRGLHKVTNVFASFVKQLLGSGALPPRAGGNPA